MSGKPSVYVVAWPDHGIFKVGFTAAKRLTRFKFSGAQVVAQWGFDSYVDAYTVETLLQDVAGENHPPAFLDATDEARELLGNKGGGYRECYAGTADDARAVIDLAMHRAMLEADATEADRA